MEENKIIKVTASMAPSDDYQRYDGTATTRAALLLSRGETLRFTLAGCATPGESLGAAAMVAFSGSSQENWVELLGSVRGIGPKRLALWRRSLLAAGINPQEKIVDTSRHQQRIIGEALLESTSLINLGVNTIHDILREQTDQKRWLLCRELGWSVPVSYGGRRRADLIAINPQSGQRIIYEIKTSRRDLEQELRRPNKSLPAMFMAQLFFIVTPAGLKVDPEELKPEMGLIQVDFKDQTSKILKKPPMRQVCRPPKELLIGMERWKRRNASQRDITRINDFIRRFQANAPLLADRLIQS